MNSKQGIGEEVEKIEAMGQDSEKKAAKWVIEEGEAQRKAEDQKEANELDVLTKKRKKQQMFGYTDEIVQATVRRMKEFDVPKGFDWRVYKTKEGRGIELRYMRPDKQVFARGMNVSFSPNHDVNWIIRTLHKALDEMEAFDELINPEQYANQQDKIYMP